MVEDGNPRLLAAETVANEHGQAVAHVLISQESSDEAPSAKRRRVDGSDSESKAVKSLVWTLGTLDAASTATQFQFEPVVRFQLELLSGPDVRGASEHWVAACVGLLIGCSCCRLPDRGRTVSCPARVRRSCGRFAFRSRLGYIVMQPIVNLILLQAIGAALHANAMQPGARRLLILLFI